MKSLEKKGDQEKPPPHFSQWKEGESMGLIPLVFFQKIVSRVCSIGGNSSKRLDSLLSISGKVSELLAEEALLSLQCCNQNLVLRFSRISNKKRLSVILSKLRGEAGQQKKKSYTTKSQSFGLLRKRTTSKQLREFSKNLFWPIGFLEAKSTLL